ncbi:MAG: hypothetical protein K6U89_03775 [Chloroflexi bacterium]|nr:hypothetical protein [Chloroflexota bacterium]GIW11296.1 MAG: hypothetical protein KatS3mg061_2353 [Dehalococcoidia bacterium]
MEQSAGAATRTSKYVPKVPIEVWAFTATEAYRGTVHRLEGQRLSDVLNDILSSALKGPRTRFLPLTQVTIQPLAGGEPVVSPFVALNKAQVLLVGERQGGPASVEPGLSRAGLRRVAVRALLSGQISLTGALFCPAGKRTLDVLNDEREFLPVVAVTVRWPAGVAGQFEFAAVNKGQLQRVEEIGVSHEPAAGSV